MLCYRCYIGLGRLVVLYFIIDAIEDLKGQLSYALLSILQRTWRINCPTLCYRCYRGLGRIVVLYLVIDVIEDLEGLLCYTLLSMLQRTWMSYTLLSMLQSNWKDCCPILCYLCYRGFVRLVVQHFVIYVIEELSG